MPVLFPARNHQVGMCYCVCVFQLLLPGLGFLKIQILIGGDFLIDYPGTRGHCLGALAESPCRHSAQTLSRGPRL